MCHDIYHTRERLKDEIARELLEEEPEAEAAEPSEDGLPSFLNEERDADVDILTDGGEAGDARRSSSERSSDGGAEE